MLKLLQHNKNTGFTLLEVLLVVAFIGVLFGIGAPVYQSFQNRNDLDIAANTIAQTLRRAQVLSQAVDGDTTWGAYVASGSITLYKGGSYASRDTSYDEVFDMPTSITSSGISEVTFNKLAGVPQTTGTITLTSANNDVRTITINEKGTINY